MRAVKKGGKRSEWQRCLNKWRRSELITMEKFQRKESFNFQGKVMSSLKKKKKKGCNEKTECVFFSVCEKVWKKTLKNSGACDYGTGAGLGSLQTDRERDIYLELQSARLWGGVRYCSRAWQGQEGRRGGDRGRRVGSRDRVCPWGRGVLPPSGGGQRMWGQLGGGRVGIGRFSWRADAQYADV